MLNVQHDADAQNDHCAEPAGITGDADVLLSRPVDGKAGYRTDKAGGFRSSWRSRAIAASR
jgi:hypothetical protein